jgi:hypothetical protein
MGYDQVKLPSIYFMNPEQEKALSEHIGAICATRRSGEASALEFCMKIHHRES